MISLSWHQWTTHILLSSQTWASRTMLPLLSLMSISDKPIVKMVYHVVNITSTEAKFFAIRCSINQATNLLEISKIIIITNSIHIARLIFDSSVHFSQVYLIAISKELRKFFITNNDNSIEFWEYPSCCNWLLFKSINRDTKQFCQTPLLSCKLL